MDSVIRVEVDSEASGVGKSTVASLIYHTLKRAGYWVHVEPVSHETVPEGRRAEYREQELDNVTGEAGLALLGIPQRSNPRAKILLVVHG